MYRLAFLFCLLAPALAVAEGTPGGDLTRNETAELQLKPVEVPAERLKTELFFRPVEDEKIYSGKKATIVSNEEQPELTTNNYRQAFSRIPGLLTSEVGNEGFASFSYRGVGDPHESFNLLLLQDGIPLNVDPYGYSAAYFVPPIESIGEIEFVRGGASLLYGPLPGGAVNFRSKLPAFDRSFTASTKQVWGSKSLYSTFNEVSGTVNDLSYRGFFHHRDSESFRRENGDYAVDNAHLDFHYRFAPDTVADLTFDVYSSDHGEAGGVGITPGEGVVTFGEDRFASTRKYDRLRIERYFTTMRLRHEISTDLEISETLWGGFVRRYSKRQAQGSTPSFGGIADGLTNTIAIQEFLTFGSDTRLTRSYELLGKESTLSASLFLYGVHSPFTEQSGEFAWSEAGDIQKDLDRDSLVGSVAIENMFALTKDLKITPGVRLENIHQDIAENRNVTAVGDLRSDDNFVSVPLLGIGASYTLVPSIESYANISQGYRPISYQDAVPLGPGDAISSDLDPTKSLTYELGMRGASQPWLTWDASLFFIDFDDQVGRVGNVIQNVGRSVHQGVDLASELELFGLARDVLGGTIPEDSGRLSLIANVSFLDAEFTKGPVDGNVPQYAPDYLARTGLTYATGTGTTKLSFLGTFVDDHFGDDGNVAERRIPSYKVWDLLAEIAVYKDTLSITGGINNIFDEKYYARIRGNGIDPANPRNYYAGFRLAF